MTRVRGDANAAKGVLVKLRPKTFDNFRHVIANVVQRVSDRKVSGWSAALPERYLRNDVRVHAHVRGGFHEFCAIFEHSVRQVANVRVIGCVAPAIHEGPDPNDLNEAVLVGKVYLPEQVERVGFAATPALIRLQPLDHCLMFWKKITNHAAAIAEFHPLELFDLDGTTLPVEPRSARSATEKYGELNVGCRCLHFRVQKRELIDQAVKSGAEVVGNVADINSPVRARYDIRSYAIDVLTRLRIELRPDNLILFIGEEGVFEPSEGIEVVHCSPDLEARAIERMHDVYSDRDRSANPEDPARSGNPGPQARGLPSQPQEGGEAEALNSPPSPEEGASQTERGHRSGGCSATHTRSGSPEDA